MSTREELKLRHDVPNEDIDDVIGRAAELQEEARRANDGRASVKEIEAVAEELDISPEYVEIAIRDLKEQHAQAAAQAAADKAASAAQRSKLTKIVAAVLAATLVITGTMGFTGRSALNHGAEQAALTEAALVQVVERQADLAPQLMALSGGNSAALQAKAQAVRDATTTSARLDASRALGLAMAEAMGALPEPTGDMAQQQRLELHHEVLGSRNRVDTEARRHAEAMAAWQVAAQRPDARVAQAIGWGQAPN